MQPIPRQPRTARRRWWMAAACLVLVWAGAHAARAVTAAEAAEAAEAFAAHTRAFYRSTNGLAWHARSTDGGRADFWMQAEQLEMVLDVHERTGGAQPLVMFTNLFHGFLAHHGTHWSRNPFNDDIMWMVIACARAHLLTGHAGFRDVARTNFDLCLARASSADLGGGLWWKTDNRSKNACVNGPGAIAAFLLGRATGEGAYYRTATNLFLWERANLFDPVTGRVSDNIHRSGRVSSSAYTYNQGTFVGAANLLGFTNEARLAALYTVNRLGRDGFLPAAGESGDGGGFNGIAVRWIARFMRERGEETAFAPWLRKNAEAAWHARRAPDNLSWCRWPEPTPEGRRYSWGCSSAVVLLQVAPWADPVRPADAR